MSLPTGPLHLWSPLSPPDEVILSGIRKLERRVRVLGLDLGKSQDHSAAAIIDVRRYSESFNGPRYPYWKVVSLRVWPLGYDYPKVMDDVLRLRIDAACIDYGGAGRPWVDFLMREAAKQEWNAKVFPVQVIGGRGAGSVRVDSGLKYHNINKRDIVSAMQIAQEQGILRLPRTPQTKILQDQMRRFSFKNPTVHGVAMEASSGNDDLVFATALVCWWLHNFGRGEAFIS